MENSSKLEKKFELTIWEILLIIFLSIVFLSVPMIVFNNTIDLNYLEKPTGIGNNIGGLLAPFLSLAGSILVYIAFKSQIQANKEIQSQFTKQNNDQHFFRLIDSLDKRITQYSFTVDQELFSGYNILSYFLKKIRQNLNNRLAEFGRRIFIYHPELISDADYKSIYKHFNDEIYSDYHKLKNIFINSNLEDRDEIFQNGMLQYQMDDDESFENAMRRIGISNFYAIPVNKDFRFYNNSINELIKANTSFFDGYFKTLELILNHIHHNNDEAFYINYLRGNLTTIEKAIIFLYLGTYRNKEHMNGLIIKYELLDDLATVVGIKIGSPTKDEYIEHIHKYLKG